MLNPIKKRANPLSSRQARRTEAKSTHLIWLSRSKGGVSNTTLSNWKVTFSKLCILLSKPSIGDKDGSYFIRGPVSDVCKRLNANITEANLVILDGDSRILAETGEISEGAPPPEQVHQVLCKLSIPHIIYTSHSHGRKGDRYRVLVGTDRPMANSTELKKCVDWLIDKLHAAGVLLNSVSENYRWAQPWYFPRVATDDAPFQCLVHDGDILLSVEKCLKWAESTIDSEKLVVATTASISCAPALTDPYSPIGKYNAEHGNAQQMLKFLVAHKYALKGQTRINRESAFRLLAPGSSSQQPGVILFKTANGVWRICSHHNIESDVLAGRDPEGKYLVHDAFDIFRILDHQGDLKNALAAITPKKAVIKVSGGTLAKNVHQAIRLIGSIEPPAIFQRGSMLGRVVHQPQMIEVEGCKIPAGTAVIVVLSPTDLTIRLCGIATWKRSARKGENIVWRVVDPPSQVARGILSAQGDWHKIPYLKAIAETPILRRDGTIHDMVGYDPVTGLYYEGSCPPLVIPKKPTRNDARRAAKKLLKVFAEFPFVDSATAKSVILAYIFTLILRGQLTLVPLTAISATTAGTGKGLLIEVCNLIVRGRDAAIMPPVSGGGAEEETRKRITALLLQGATSVNLDNWVTPIGGESLNGLLTANEWSDRVLGRSEAVKLPNRVTWAATGNNLTVRGDMVRRTVYVQMDAERERPELREFKVPNLTQYVLEHRAELLSAAFTILVAYHLAGRPEDDGPVLGRFEDWSRSICAPIRWIGRPDPIQSQEKLRHDDPEANRLERLLGAWYAVFDDKAVSVTELIEAATSASLSSNEKQAELRDALLECAGERGFVNTKKLGWYLKHFAGRIVTSLRLQRVEEQTGRSKTSRSRTPKYYVVESS